MRTLVIAHVFYAEMWPELAACIRNAAPRDIVVTYVDERAVVQARRDFPQARFLACENRGYDIWPFLAALKTVDLAAYDLVVKLHTKRDLVFPFQVYIAHTLLNGPAWREHLLAFVRAPDAWARTLRRFSNPRTGLVADRHVIFTRRDSVKDQHRASFDAALAELNRDWGLAAHRNGRYVGGTMFAVRAALLKPFAEHDFRPEAFSASGGHETETYAHVMERMLGLAVCAQGYRVVAFNGSVFWRRVGHRIAKFLFDRRESERRRSIRICGITVYLKRLSS